MPGVSAVKGDISAEQDWKLERRFSLQASAVLEGLRTFRP
jgi:hypothetical protein